MSNIKNENNENLEYKFINLLFNIYCNYSNIFSNEVILNFIVESDKMVDRYKTFFPTFTRRELECAYLAMTIMFITDFQI